MARILMSTLPPTEGGVPHKAAILARFLAARGHSVTVAHYATLSGEPELVAPSWRLAAGAQPGIRVHQCFGGLKAVAVGCWLPELEFTYVLPSKRWDALIAAHERHLAVGGTVLASYPLLAAGVPHFVWCASPMLADRLDRRADMAPPRRLLDRAVIGPVQAAMERRILQGSGLIVPVSAYARHSLAELGGRAGEMDIVPIPVDVGRFAPPTAPAPAGVVGFAGRLNDPRKNLPLLLAAVRLAVSGGADLRLEFTGTPSAALTAQVRAMGLADRVRFHGTLPATELQRFYQGLDLFAIPSHQEGFGIVGIEALACGVPVVSTRCGGPADYVVEGETGFLVESDEAALAAALTRLAGDRALRSRMAAAGRRLVEERYSHDCFVAGMERVWQRVWGETP